MRGRHGVARRDARAATDIGSADRPVDDRASDERGRFAWAMTGSGKLGIPGLVFACDTEPVVVTRAPHDRVTLRPRRIELENVEPLRGLDQCRVLASIAELEQALSARLDELSLSWNTSSS
jgi:hypothetical protein